MTDKELGTAAGEIFAKAFTLGYETGREYVPVGGRVLTAELVEDVEALVATANPYSAPAARLRALFPATEPAKETAAEYVERTRRLQSTTLPTPAEPAEEETKAEHNTSVARREALGRVAQQLYEQSFDGCDGTFYHDFGRALEDFLPSQGWTRIPTSLPVVPAPTETGPWETCGHVPIGIVFRSKDRHPAFTWVNAGGSLLSVRNECEDGHFSDGEHCSPSMVDEHFAPFVAAKEG